MVFLFSKFGYVFSCRFFNVASRLPSMQILTRLNPKTVNFDSIGGIPDLTTADICAALAGANKAGLELLLYQVCGMGKYNRLCELFTPEAEKLAKRLKWKIRGDRNLVRFLRLMLAEYVSDKKCPSCRGTKYSKIDPSKECRTCRGTGVYILPDNVKAGYIGISKSAYCRYWVKREEEVKALFDRRVYQVKVVFKDNFYEIL